MMELAGAPFPQQHALIVPQPLKIRAQGPKFLHKRVYLFCVTTNADSPEFRQHPSRTAFPVVKKRAGVWCQKNIAQQIAFFTVQPTGKKMPGRVIGGAGVPQGIKHITGHCHLPGKYPDLLRQARCHGGP